MRKIACAVIGAAFLSLAFVSAAAAQEISGSDVQIVNVVTSLNNDTSTEGSAAIVQRLEKTFSVSADQISALRAQGQG